MFVKTSLLVALLFLVLIPVASLPTTYTDEPSGWFEISVSYDRLLSSGEVLWGVELHFYGEDLTWIPDPRIGFGMTVAWSKDTFIFTIDSVYMADLFDSTQLALPFKLKAGVDIFSDSYFFAALTGGIEAFWGQWTGLHEHDLDEEVCINLGVAAGIAFSNLKIEPLIGGALGISTANAYTPSDIVYYY